LTVRNTTPKVIDRAAIDGPLAVRRDHQQRVNDLDGFRML